MIEIIAYNFLKGKLGNNVYTELPKEDVPEEYVIFERTAGGEVEHIKNATLAVQSVSTSLLKAVELNERVKDAMATFAELDSVSACTLNSDYNYSDTTTKRYRYQAVFNIIYY